MNIPKDNKEFFKICYYTKNAGKTITLGHIGPILTFDNKCKSCRYIEFCLQYISREHITPEEYNEIGKTKCSHAILIARIET